VYDGADIVLVADETGSLTDRFLTGPDIDQILAGENGAGDVRWFLADQQGTTRDVAEYDSGTDTTSIVNHLQYDSFGRITDQTAPGEQPLFAYTGLMWDADAELQYSRARWYDPMVGRFLSEDPLSFAAGDANLTRYVSNAPTNYVDPSGLDGMPNGSTTGGSVLDLMTDTFSEDALWRARMEYLTGQSIEPSNIPPGAAIAAPVLNNVFGGVRVVTGASAMGVALLIPEAPPLVVAIGVWGADQLNTGIVQIETGTPTNSLGAGTVIPYLVGHDTPDGVPLTSTLQVTYDMGPPLAIPFIVGGTYAPPTSYRIPLRPRAVVTTPVTPMPQRPPVRLYHMGDLSGGISRTRTLSTSPTPELIHYHPNGRLYRFDIPRDVLDTWLDQRLVRPFTDRHDPTGIYTPEIRFYPPATWELDQYVTPH